MVLGSSREQSKADRRAKIIEAAISLMREHGYDQMSVKMIAARAGVAPASVYNLFGTKSSIMAKVFEQDFINYEHAVLSVPAANTLERFFDAIDITVDMYARDPRFFRAFKPRVWSSLDGDENDDISLRATVREPRIRFWRSLVEAAIDEGYLVSSANSDLLGVLMLQAGSGVRADWVANAITIDRFRLEFAYTFAVILSAFATDVAKKALHRRMQALEKEMKCGGRRLIA